MNTLFLIFQLHLWETQCEISETILIYECTAFLPNFNLFLIHASLTIIWMFHLFVTQIILFRLRCSSYRQIQQVLLLLKKSRQRQFFVCFFLGGGGGGSMSPTNVKSDLTVHQDQLQVKLNQRLLLFLIMMQSDII